LKSKSTNEFKMDMGMGGMTMSSDPGLRTVNQRLAHDFWFIIAGLVGAILILRTFEKYEVRSRLVIF